MSNLRKIVWYSGYSYILMPLTLATNIILRRWLDPYEMGILNILTIMAGYSLYSNLGVLSRAEIQLPYLKSSLKCKKYNDLDYYAYKSCLIGGVVFSVASLLIYFIYFKATHPDIKTPLIIYTIYFLNYQLVSYYITKNRTESNFIFLAKYQFLASIVTNASALIASYLVGILGYIIVTTSLMILQVQYLRIKTTKTSEQKFDVKKLLLQVRASTRVLWLGISSLLIRNVDSIIVGALLGPTSLGYYSLATIGTTIIFSITNSVANVLFPSLQTSLGKSNNNMVYHRYVALPLVAMALILPLGIALLYYLVPAILGAFAPAFLPGINAFQILIWGAYYLSLLNILGAYLNSRNRQLEIFKINMLSICVFFILLGLFSRMLLSVNGISMAMSICYALCYCVMYYKSTHGWMNKGQLYKTGLLTILSPLVGLLNIYVAEVSCGYFLNEDDSCILIKLITFYLISLVEIIAVAHYIGLIKEYVRRNNNK